MGETILEDASDDILIHEAMVAKGMNSERILVLKCETVCIYGIITIFKQVPLIQSVKFSFTKKKC